MFLKSYVDWYPDAQVIGVKGLPEKKAEEGIKFDFIFDRQNNTKSFGPNDEVRKLLFAVLRMHRSRLGFSRVIGTKKWHSSINRQRLSLKLIWYSGKW